jgi:hypothetical protein
MNRQNLPLPNRFMSLFGLLPIHPGRAGFEHLFRFCSKRFYLNLPLQLPHNTDHFALYF